MVQPPTAGTAKGVVVFFLKTIDRKNGQLRGARMGQGGIVLDPQIIAKPHNYGAICHINLYGPKPQMDVWA